MKIGDEVVFLHGKHAGEIWFVNHIEVAYWDDDDGVRHASYDVSVVPNVGAFCAMNADYDNLQLVERAK
jgi:hypothetical protein